MTRIYAWDFTEEQLLRVQGLAGFRGYFHIIHLLYDDLTDHYVVIAECEPRWATWVELM